MKPLLYLSPVAWHGLWQRPQRLAQGLAEHFALTYVNPVGLRSARLSDCRRLFSRGKNVAPPATVPVWRPRYVPWHSPTCDALNRRWLRSQLERDVPETIRDGYTLWIGAPSLLALTLLESTRPGLVIYDCMDHFASFHGGRAAAAIEAAETAILERADLVLATSRPLYQSLSPRHPRVKLAPNGVDFEHFAGISRSSTPPARPVIGFHGTLGEWLDYELMRKLASERPHWRWAFVGPVHSKRARMLQRLSNVSIQPEVPFSELSERLATFDVGIVPFVRNRLTDAAQPVKLWEYLAAGLPVVASRLDSLDAAADHVHLVNSPAAWLAALDAAISSAAREAPLVQARRELAAAHSWNGTLEIVLAALAELGETSAQHEARRVQRTAA